MEEAEKRKERIRATRIESDQEFSSSPVQLFNPLTQTPTTSTSSNSRFGYYTDPVSAYSGTRGTPRVHQRPDQFSSPVRSFSQAYSPLPSSSPGGRGSPQFHFQGHQFQQANYHYESSIRGPRSGSPWRSPLTGPRPFSEFNSAGRGARGSSPASYQGRGSSYGRSGSGRGSTEFASARERPDLFANKMMLVDPWRGMEPVVGCILVSMAKKMSSDDGDSWLPSSIRMKKGRIEEGSASAPRSQVSLAQSIALAFEEAAAEDGVI